MKEKRSFFERLTGAASLDDYVDEEEESLNHASPLPKDKPASRWLEEDTGEGELAVDVYQTPTHIVIKTMVAGVRRDDLDISSTRDSITIKGRREAEPGIAEQDYFHKELYWGSFSRTIMLPHEVEIDGAEATENQGLLTVRLPKIDKARQTKLKVRAA